MAADLTEAVGQIMAGHIGEGWGLRRSEILALVQRLGSYPGANDRAIRSAIESLRQDGWLIVNMCDDSGYYVAGSLEEYQNFRRLYLSYATTVLSRIKAMDRSASVRWGAGALQDKLF